jgi:hypothetical protein
MLNVDMTSAVKYRQTAPDQSCTGLPVEAAEQTAHSQERSAQAAEPVCGAQGLRRDGTGTADD